jgi:transcription elongation factor GreA-like protein
MIKNENNVAKQQWNEWSDKAKEVFNKSYEFIFSKQALMTYPKMEYIIDSHWKTVAWNDTWISADAFDNTIPT